MGSIVIKSDTDCSWLESERESLKGPKDQGDAKDNSQPQRLGANHKRKILTICQSKHPVSWSAVIRGVSLLLNQNPSEELNILRLDEVGRL